jgi:hypothetical protein
LNQSQDEKRPTTCRWLEDRIVFIVTISVRVVIALDNLIVQFAKICQAATDLLDLQLQVIIICSTQGKHLIILPLFQGRSIPILHSSDQA